MGLGEGGVIRLLNMERSPGAKRVAELVEAFRRATELLEAIRGSSVSDSKQHAAVCNALSEINSRIAQFRWMPAILGFNEAESHFKVRYLMIVGMNDDGAKAYEQFAIQWIVDHVDAVHRIRHCYFPQCRKWFFAKTDHQKYCGDNCRQRDAAQGESFKEKRRLYMKKYRREEAATDKRAKQFVRGK